MYLVDNTTARSPTMPTLDSSVLLKLIGGVVVAVLSFWITLTILKMQQPSLPPEPITVVEATYGLACDGTVPPTRTRHVVDVGNVTQKVAEECNGARDKCVFRVDVSKLGDAAPGCAKD